MRSPERAVFSDPLPQEVDVVVIGGGTTGLSAALEACRQGCSVLLLESDRVGSGATGHSGGMLTREPGEDFSVLAERYGMDVARRVADALSFGLNHLRELVGEESDACDWMDVPAVYYGVHPEDIAQIHREWSALRGLGGSVEWLDREVFSDARPFLRGRSGLQTTGHVAVDPYRLVQVLATRLRRAGGMIREGVVAQDIKQEGGGIRVQTQEGVVKAEHVIVCAESVVETWFGSSSETAWVEETVMVTEPVPVMVGWEDHALLWNGYPLFEYARYLPDRRILFGSGRTLSPVGGDPGLALEIVKRAFEETFTMTCPRIEAVWSQSYAISDRVLPRVQEVLPGVVAVRGLQDHGLVLGSLLGSMAVQHVLGQVHPYQDMFEGHDRISEKKGESVLTRWLRHVSVQGYVDQKLQEDLRARNR